MFLTLEWVQSSSPANSTVAALEARSDGVTISFVQQALIHEEKKRSLSGDQRASDSALVGEQKGIKPHANGGLRCFGPAMQAQLERAMTEARSTASASIGHIIALGESLHDKETYSRLQHAILPFVCKNLPNIHFRVKNKEWFQQGG